MSEAHHDRPLERTEREDGRGGNQSWGYILLAIALVVGVVVFGDVLLGLFGGIIGIVVGILAGIFGLIVGLAGGILGIVVAVAAALFAVAVALLSVAAVALPFVAVIALFVFIGWAIGRSGGKNGS